MKVLPAILDDIKDFEKVGNEFYFKKHEDIELQNVDDESILNRENLMKTVKTMFDSTEPSTSVHVSSYGKSIEHDDGIKNTIENGIDSSNSVTNRMRDVRSTLITPSDEVHNHKYHSISSRQPTPTAGTVSHHIQRSTTANQWNDEWNTGVFETLPDDIDVGIDILNMSENQTKAQLDAKIVRAKNDFTVIKTNRADIDRKWDDDSEYDSYEDYEVKQDGPRVWRKNKIRTHESYQKTAVDLRSLQQGFIASPGYPSYYVGAISKEETECHWRITVNSGQPIRLVLLDVDLRCKLQ